MPKVESAKIGGTKTVITSLQEKIKAAEDKAFVAKTGADFGFKKLNRASEWSKEILYSNEGAEKLERAINCQRCVVAHEARLRGYDVTSRPSYGATDELRQVSQWLKVFDYSPSEIHKCIGKTGDEVIKSAEKIIRNFGKGARAFVWFDWNKAYGLTEGHVIAAQCNDNGAVIFADPQTKERAAAQKLKMADFDSVKILRVDNLKFTDLVKRCCKNRGEADDNS